MLTHIESVQRHIGVVAKPYLCFAACLQVAIKATLGTDLDQVAIANYLGVVLPEGDDVSELLDAGVTNLTFNQGSPSLWGINPVLTEINAALKSERTPLFCEFERISLFQDWEFEERVFALTASHQFPIVGFDYGYLLGTLRPGDQGHCAVCYGVQGPHGRCSVELYDPGPREAGIRIVDSQELYYAARKKQHGGIWRLSRLD